MASKRKRVANPPRPGPPPPAEPVAVQPWERQEGESAPAFAAFLAYRDQGPERSLRGVAQQLDKSDTIVGQWSSRWHWVYRCRQWENFLVREGQRAQVEAIRAMHVRHAEAFTTTIENGLRKIKKLNADNLTPTQALAYLVEGVKGERQARGEPGEIVEEQKTTDAIGDDDRRRVYRAALADPQTRELLGRLAERIVSPAPPAGPGQGAADGP